MSICKKHKLFMLISMTVFVFALSFFCLKSGIYVVYQYLFLIPMITACYWYKKTGIAYSAIVSVIHVALYYSYAGQNLPEETAKVLVFIAIAVFTEFLMEKLDRNSRDIVKLNRQMQNYLEMMKKSEELSHMGSWRLNLKTNVMIWSDGLYRIFGMEPKDVEPSLQKRLEITYPDDREIVKSTIMDSVVKRKSTQVESRIIRPDGRIRWLLSIGYTEYNECGEASYIGSFIDITDRKLYEDELYKERERFKITLASIGDGVIATDISGNVTLLNRQAEKLTGWEYRQAIGKPFDEVFNIINESTRKKCQSPIQKVIKSGLIIGLANHTVLISKYGSEYSIADSAAPIKNKKGKILGVVIVFRDVTEEKKRQTQINYISYHDALTGLYNRRFFEEQLIKIDKKENLPIAVIMGDVNGLKVTNDAFGHAEGDRLLQKASEAIKAACRTDDIVARCGGDEYVILLSRTNKATAEKIIERIMKIESEMTVGPINVSVSFGCGVKENENENILTTLKNAEDHMYENKVVESESMRGKLIETTIETLCESNPYEIEHYKRVGELAKNIGKAMLLPRDDISKLKMTGHLHDIGKIAITSDILMKEGPLSQREWDEIRRHPDIGYKILKSSRDTAGIADYVLSHHERFDGKGYPAGLKGEKIPLVSRIVAVADAFDVMTHDRSYRRAMSKAAAIRELIANKGTQFDPDIVDIAVGAVLNK